MSEVEVTFPRLNQFWNDSGVLGLYRCIIGEVHADPQAGDNDLGGRLDDRFEVDVRLEKDGLVVKGDADTVEGMLNAAYDRLVKRYYDISTLRQREDTGSHNFYYDSASDIFKTFSKRKSRGIATFIYDKAPRPAGEQVKWEGKQAGKLPESHAHLQERLEAFLDQQGIKAGPPAGMLVDQPNRVRPKVTLQVKEGKAKPVACFLCGGTSSKMEKVNQTTFPFITGDAGVLSFFNLTREVSQVCWRCAFVGKFVPVNGFFIQSGDRLHMFFPFAPHLLKMNDVYSQLSPLAQWEPNFWRNVEHNLGGYFSHPRETGFAFFHAVFEHLVRNCQDGDYEEDGYEELEEVIFDTSFRDAPLSFAMVSTEQKGQIQMPTQVWLFNDLFYLFRLFREVISQDGDWKAIVRSMVDFTAQRDENRSLERDRMLGTVMKKQSILKKSEEIAYHVNRSQRQYIAPLVDFVYLFEKLLQKGDAMDKDALEAAVTLGKRVGSAVARDRGKKGSLFTLRKCRTLPDFLNQLNRLQFRFEIAVPPATYQGHLNQENFEEFRGFCMLAALNAFNAGTSQREKAGGEE